MDPALCIDCGACGRICPDAAVLDECGSPVSALRPDEWPRPRWNSAACIKCRICVAACPTGSIQLAYRGERRPDQNGACPHLAHPRTCIGCSLCSVSCPTGAIVMAGPATTRVRGQGEGR